MVRLSMLFCSARMRRTPGDGEPAHRRDAAAPHHRPESSAIIGQHGDVVALDLGVVE